MKMNWSRACHHLSQQGQSYVLVTLVAVAGSTPRNNGTKMVVSKDGIFDTIGGGHLEHKVIKQANKLLRTGKAAQQIEHFQLGSQLGQCCGGSASVLFECFAQHAVNIMLFGAGHVGKALVPILAQLPCHITWVDSRAEQFTNDLAKYDNLNCIVSDAPELEVARMPAASYFIVMTHNHQLDFAISQAVLTRADFHYLGLIASATKWRRFQQRFKHREIDPSQVARMSCPIGLSQVAGKLPIEVAVSIAAEIIHCYQQQQAEQAQSLSIDTTTNLSAQNSQAKPVNNVRARGQQGVCWQDIKPLLTNS
ncbi:molybdenum cofactor sulfurylase [Colwellia chukchiensis]|uniref:Molybdenum cofactor sulfurylase n=1 Tax=Colwellia chukchiensis TaxID=641665 RepID=A0A1H7NYJ4_9GAMM|nr:xanthine dehydrogenase accessory protein XdhC [Colwellia chukchiensis]SEL27927.1 molybdenum cofactor sulfurylase [Colwellia chukchiensis]